MREVQFLDSGVERLGNVQRTFFAGIGKDGNELFTTIACQ